MTCKSAYKSTYMFVYVTCMFHIFCHILCIYEMFQFNIYTIYDIYVLSYYLDGDIYVADICNSIYSGIYVTPHIYAKIYDFFYMSHIFCSVWVSMLYSIDIFPLGYSSIDTKQASGYFGQQAIGLVSWKMCFTLSIHTNFAKISSSLTLLGPQFISRRWSFTWTKVVARKVAPEVMIFNCWGINVAHLIYWQLHIRAPTSSRAELLVESLLMTCAKKLLKIGGCVLKLYPVKRGTFEMHCICI